MKRTIIGVALTLSFSPLIARAQSGQEPARIRGTIVSVRGNILQIRPSLRPKLARVLVSNKTEIVGMRKSDRSFLKPGMRVRCGGMYSETSGIGVFFIQGSATPLGELKQPFHGVEKQDGGWAMAGGTIKSVEPFVLVDDDGKELKGDLSRARFFMENFAMEKNGLLIGTRIMSVGTIAPDGVMQADVVSPERDQSASGTMYGEVVKVDGDHYTVRPRYTQDTITVLRKSPCVLQREVHLDPDHFKSGDTVTFWGNYIRQGPDVAGQPKRLGALALLVGEGRYPTSSDPEAAGVFVTGKLTALSPVTVTTADGATVEVIVPAQIAIARLDKIQEADIKPGVQVMMVLEPGKGDTFQTSHIIIDASPWVGYGG